MTVLLPWQQQHPFFWVVNALPKLFCEPKGFSLEKKLSHFKIDGSTELSVSSVDNQSITRMSCSSLRRGEATLRACTAEARKCQLTWASAFQGTFLSFFLKGNQRTTTHSGGTLSGQIVLMQIPSQPLCSLMPILSDDMPSTNQSIPRPPVAMGNKGLCFAVLG